MQRRLRDSVDEKNRHCSVQQSYDTTIPLHTDYIHCSPSSTASDWKRNRPQQFLMSNNIVTRSQPEAPQVQWPSFARFHLPIVHCSVRVRLQVPALPTLDMCGLRIGPIAEADPQTIYLDQRIDGGSYSLVDENLRTLSETLILFLDEYIIFRSALRHFRYHNFDFFHKSYFTFSTDH